MPSTGSIAMARDTAFAKVLLDLRRDVERFRYRESFAGDAHGVVDGG